MKLVQRYLVFILMLCLMPLALAQDDLKGGFQKRLDQWRQTHHIPGAVLLIDSPIYKGTFTSGTIGPASKGVVMSAEDQAKWSGDLFRHKELSAPKQLDAMLKEAAVSEGKIKAKNTDYPSKVIHTKSVKAKNIVWYTAVTPFHTAVYSWDSNNQVLIIVLARFDRQGNKNANLRFPDKELMDKITHWIGMHSERSGA